MKASGVSRTPSCVALPLSATRAMSRSVISASSCCVTCGRLIQLACRRAPEMRWMRDSGLTSTGAEFREVDFRHLGQSRRAAAGGARQQPLHVRLHVLVSDAPLRPGSLTCPRSAPSSRANLRTEGLAYAVENAFSSIEPRRAAAALGRPAWHLGARGDAGLCAAAAGGLAGSVAAGVRSSQRRSPGGAGSPQRRLAACAAALARAAASPSRRLVGAAALCAVLSSNRITLPSDTLSPFLTLTSAIRPARGRRHVHRGFFGLERDQRRLFLDLLAVLRPARRSRSRP